ncbi:MAG TPA: FBP domain-containing protein [Polyangia bacterium]
MAAPSTIASYEELLTCFRRIDRKEVELAEGLSFPLKLHRVVTWSYGHRAFLVFRDPRTGDARGIVFHRTSGAESVLSMCHWCQRSRGRGAVKLLTARAGSRRTVGQYLCGDLSCFRSDDDEPGGGGDIALHRIERAFDRMYQLFTLRLA